MSGDEAFMRRGQLGGGRQAAGKQSGSRVGEEDESDLEAAGEETLGAKCYSIGQGQAGGEHPNQLRGWGIGLR